MIKVSHKIVSHKHPCFIIAEAGVNHNGDINLAFQLIEAAAKAGADAIKFQSFFTENLVTRKAPKADYQINTTGKEEDQFSMLKKLELSKSQHGQLKKCADEKELIYLSTPYDTTSADDLSDINVPAFKIASTDTNNYPFITHLAKKNVPIFLSTGMSTLGEIEHALTILNQEFNKAGLESQIILLHCVSQYPAPIDQLNLNAIKTLKTAFQCPVGYSDHSNNTDVPSWAVSIGACTIEKHFTLDKNLIGPDHKASANPEELKQIVHSIRNVEKAMGSGIKKVMPCEENNKIKMQKSIVLSRNISQGEILEPTDVMCKRPGNGLPPSWLNKIIGQRATHDLKQDNLLSLNDIDWS